MNCCRRARRFSWATHGCVTGAILALACGNADGDFGTVPQNRTQPAESKTRDTVLPLVSELQEHVDSRGVATPDSVQRPSLQSTLAASSFNSALLVEALADGDGVEPDVTDESKSSRDYTSQVGTKRIRIDFQKARVSINDDRGYQYDGDQVQDEAVLMTRASPVLSALGVDESEVVSIVRGLGSRSRDVLNPGPAVSVRRANVLIIKRVVGGVPVTGDRLAICFALDGTVRKVLGRWHPVDYDSVNVPARAATDPGSVTQLALDSIAAGIQNRGLAVLPSQPVRVATVFEPIGPASGEFWSLALRGQVSVSLAGPHEGDTKPARWAYALD